MRKFYQNLLVIVVIITTMLSTAVAQQGDKCGTQKWLEANFKAHPELRALYEAREKKLGEAITSRLNAGARSNLFPAPVTIPIVFHVVLSAGQQAVITNAMVMAQLAVLNNDWGGHNIDSANVPAAFQAVRGHSDVSFCLAQRTPAGLATTGIDRVVSSVESTGTDFATDVIKSTAGGGADAWDPNKYVNIWLCNFTDPTLLGYGTFPIGSPEGGGALNQQGVVVLAETVPGGTAAPYNLGRTLTHELGHFFWLRHITGDTNCGNDFPNTPGIDDTPQQSNLTGGCPGSAPTVNTQASGCGSSPNPPGRMFQDFMDYTDDACMTMFTHGQDTRMEMAINMYRPSLLTSDGCQPPTPLQTFGFTTPAATTTACPAAATMSVTLATTSTGGFSTPINLTSTAGVPAGATISFGTNPVTPGNSTTVVLNNANTLSSGTYNVTITGIAGAITNTVTATFTINGGTGPAITGQPASQTICAGSNAVFTVTAAGATGYQWQVNTGSGYTNISGATAATYTVVGATAAQSGYLYHVIASTQCGSTTSSAATLTVNAAPAITSQPANTTACAGTNATFTVSATGAGLTYQWQISTDGCTTFNDIIGATSNSYTVVGVTNAMNGYGYKVVVSGTCAPSVSSNTCAILTVGNAASITSQPASTTVCVGANASFSVTATGSNLTYQWQVNTGTGFNNIAGATASTLNVPAVTAAMNGYQYLVNVYSCTAIPIVSTTATLTVNTPITISSQPSNVTLCSGSNASFSVTATGSNLTYQWQVNTGSGFNDIGGATSSTLNLAAVTAGMSGNQYHAVISGGCGAPVTSNDATLTVNTPVVISVQPADVSVCVPNSTTLSITASGTAITYQWQVSTDGGVTWSDLTDSTHSSITLTPSASMNGNQYQVILSGTCSASFASAAAILTVNTPVNIVDQPVSVNGCVGTDAVFSVNATGSTITYQWMGSVNGGPFTALTNTAPYSGVTTNTLTVSPTTTGLTGNQYFAVVSGVPCGNVFTDTVDLTIHDIPVVVLTAASFSTITPATPTTVYTTVSAPGNYTYQWFLNGNPIAATTASIPVDVSGLGDYEVIVTNTATGCTGRSNVANVHDSASNMVFVYPNPNTGSFQVRYYNANATATTYMLTIYDSKGSKVYTRNYPISNVYERMDVNMNNAESGLYFIDLRDTNGKRLGAVPFMIKR